MFLSPSSQNYLYTHDKELQISRGPPFQWLRCRSCGRRTGRYIWPSEPWLHRQRRPRYSRRRDISPCSRWHPPDDTHIQIIIRYCVRLNSLFYFNLKHRRTYMYIPWKDGQNSELVIIMRSVEFYNVSTLSSEFYCLQLILTSNNNWLKKQVR